MAERSMPFFKYQRNAEARSRLESCREFLTPILATNLQPHFTDHSMAHSESVLDLIDGLIEPLFRQGTQKSLTEDELEVLYSAALFHDVGMQFEKAGELECIKRALRLSASGLSFNDLSQREQAVVIRKHHHEMAAELVAPSGGRTSLLGMNLHATYDRVAALCHAHGCDVHSQAYKDLAQNSAGYRMDLLAALLRLADILDESRFRVSEARMRTLNLEPEALAHWYRNRYTEKVDILPESSVVRVWYDLPKDNVLLQRLIPDLQMPEIRLEFDRQRHVLSANGLSWWVTFDFSIKPYSTIQAPPADVQMSMTKMVSHRREENAAVARHAAIESYLSAQPFFAQRLQDLRNQEKDLGPQQYLRMIHAVASDLWDLGARRTASTALIDIFLAKHEALPPEEQLSMGLKLAGWLLQDRHDPFRIRALFESLEPTAESLPLHHPFREAYYEANAYASIREGKYPETLARVERALKEVSNPQSRLALHAERVEYLYLQGEFEQALTAASSEIQLLDSERKTDTHEPVRDFFKPQKTTLIRELEPDTRICLIRARCNAMAGRTSSAYQDLDERAAKCTGETDRAAIVTLKSELLQLDGKATEAASLFDGHLKHLSSPSLPEEHYSVALMNRANNAIRTLSPGAVGLFYSLVDRRRVTGTTSEDINAIIEAENAARNDRHYDALPGYWGLYLSSYQSMNQDSIRRAAVRLGRECLALKMPDKAAQLALIAHDSSFTKEVCKALADTRDPRIDKALTYILKYGNLLLTFEVGACIIQAVADQIADSRIGEIFAWLTSRGPCPCAEMHGSSIAESMWGAISHLAARLSREQAQTLVALGLSFPRTNPLDRHLHSRVLECLTGLVACLSPDALEPLLSQALDTAVQKRDSGDFVASVNLLCNIYANAPQDLRSRITTAVYPEGVLLPAPLIQTASVMGHSFKDGARFVEWAKRATTDLRLLVQEIPPDKTHVPVRGVVTTFESTNQATKTVVQSSNFFDLNAVASQAHLLDESLRRDLLDAMLLMIAHPKNDPSNTGHILMALSRMAGAIPPDMVERCLKDIQPLADGHYQIPSDLLCGEDADNPLSRFRFKTTSKEDVRGFALEALLSIAVCNEHFLEQVEQILGLACHDKEPKVRAWGYYCARKLKHLASASVSALVFGASEYNPFTSATAMCALSEAADFSLDSSQWEFITQALTVSSNSEHARVRRAASFLTVRLAALQPPEALIPKLKEVRDRLATDICFSVREPLHKGGRLP